MGDKNNSGRGEDRTYVARLPRGATIVLLSLLLAAGVGWCAKQSVRQLLPEGTVLDGLDGTISHADANDTWLFELVADVNRVDVRMSAGARLELLRSTTLGKIIADMNERVAPRYRLSAYVTRYEGKNYLLALYFLPLSKLKDAGDAEAAGSPPSAVHPPAGKDPNLAIPEEILRQLRNRRPLPETRRTPPGPGRTPDANAPRVPRPPESVERMLVDRVGLIQRENGHFVFIPYALGWNVSGARYEILPSAVLEQAVRRQAASLERMRFNVAGLVTEFHGRRYLLLQRAVPAYNFGDFGR
jgi:hypothetical protein